MLSQFSGKRVLLLQGPMGPFFWRLRKDLEAAGAEVDKINFCAGDQLFYPFRAINYRGTLKDWPDYLAGLLADRGYDAVMLFGDCRPYHAVVPHVIRFLKVRLYVFEEGYLRPDHITLEQDGVNSYSSLPRDPDHYRRFAPHEVETATWARATSPVLRAGIYATLYSIASHVLIRRFPGYEHHRPLHPLSEAFVWTRSLWRKHWFKLREHKVAQSLQDAPAGSFFLVPLQTHNDAQIRVHSDFRDIPTFIEDVMRSFAEHAPADQRLVIKHHPMDRGYREYGPLIRRLTDKYRLQGRVDYVHDVHLPMLLERARGTVVINSTVGLSSILHGTPVCVLGDPVYHMPGLTHQGTLHSFWNNPGEVDKALFKRFRAWLLAHNQANGNFYQPLPGLKGHTGVTWPPLLGAEALATDSDLDRARERRQQRNLRPGTAVLGKCAQPVSGKVV
ncbi:capsule biosynthesis protein [Ectothiorhodospira lacustris]|uniref:capsule biosynthesis protein n=1 Tax=Ectothiorhodospira lacustris TaxID=2899127 RepID=UPI001EE9AEA8|nr:capsular biosynthesis protein [Ectothiorhodospira lacustris]